MCERNSWPVVLGLTVSAKRELHDLDPEHGDSDTLPRVKLTEGELNEFEHELGERLPGEFRGFLLHADGWDGAYYDLDLFGRRELLGGGRWATAQKLLGIYAAEGVLDRIGIDPKSVIAVAAGEGNDLVLLFRQGQDAEGQVSWILNAEEYIRAEDYKAFVEFIVSQHRGGVQDLLAELD